MRFARTNPRATHRHSGRGGHADRASRHGIPRLSAEQKISGLVNSLSILRALEAQHRSAGELEDADYFAGAVARRERELKALGANLARP